MTVLRDADEATFDLLPNKVLYAKIADEAVRRKLSAARDRARERGIPPRKRLASLVREHDEEDGSAEVASIIAQMEIAPRDEGADYVVDLANDRFPRAMAEGLVQRVRDGRELPSRTIERLAAAGFDLEDESLFNVALESDRSGDERAIAAASVLGPGPSPD